MTIEHALEIINRNGWGYSEDENIEAHSIITEKMRHAVKQPPKDRSHRNDNGGLFDQGCCPSCGKIVRQTEAYCANCGQALDWSEKEAE